MSARKYAFLLLITVSVLVAAAACSAGGSSGGSGGFGGSGATATGGSGGTITGGTGGITVEGGAASGGSAGIVGDPKTCEQAAQAKTYIGCDFWPTVTFNNVWSIFDFTVVVANAGEAVADVVIARNGQQIATGQVQPNGLQKFYLPWVPELKGADYDECTTAVAPTQSVRVPGGAYHLTSSVPVTVYQFNALEYRGQGGPAGKNWSACPGNQTCFQTLGPIGCFSFSNDASLLIPSTALTGNYRIIGQRGWMFQGQPVMPAYFAITGIEDGTTVTLQVSGTGQIVAGGGLSAVGPGQVTTLPLGRGEVVEVVGTAQTDLSGSLVQADKPVQVLFGMPCVYQPESNPACDHIEETIPPAETLGKHYFVGSPTGPTGNTPGHIVRLFGNFDGTQLSYPSGAPANAPTTLSAGQVVDLGIVNQSFEVVGTEAFGVGTFMLAGSIQDPNAPQSTQKGDPAMSLATPVEQYRIKYVFLAPDDYDVSYADVIVPDGANVVIDGSPIPSAQPIGSGYGISRVQLGPGAGGAHVLVSDKPVGLQVMGFGSYTSYQYPGGLNLGLIAPPPPPVQ